jgi:hypothetical protein
MAVVKAITQGDTPQQLLHFDKLLSGALGDPGDKEGGEPP